MIYVMGVSGSGKSTIGKLLADTLGCSFYDGDDFHPEKNIKKMQSGKPLNDEDRHDWIVLLNRLAKKQSHGRLVVISCSALKESYRQTLRNGIIDECLFIYLKGDYQTILQRIKNRDDHFMPVDLLQSQFDTLEEPDYGIHVDSNQSQEENISFILKKLSK